MKQKKLKGFTLIELLVVISIIGILSSLGVVSLNSARNKARDALRKADMAQLRTALMLYYDDHNKYPPCGDWKDNSLDFGATADQAGADCYNSNNSNSLSTALTGSAKPYINPMPKDPTNPSNFVSDNPTYFYRYVGKSDGTQYALVYMIEASSDAQVIRGW